MRSCCLSPLETVESHLQHLIKPFPVACHDSVCGFFKQCQDTVPWLPQVVAVVVGRPQLVALVCFFFRLAEALKPGDTINLQQCVNWLLTMSEAVLSAYTHAMNTCQAAGPQDALKQDYERARNVYLQVLLNIAADRGEVWGTWVWC